MKKWLAYGLIVVGLFVIAYPVAAEWYDNKVQEKMLAQWEQELAEESAREKAQAEFNDLTALFEEQNGNGAQAVQEESEEDEDENELAQMQQKAAPAIATIQIPSINLKLPVLEGATQKNMKYAAAHLSETAGFGKVGNAAISAHRMRASGRLFNRLDEVSIGDKITVTQGKETFEYTVYDVSIVDPSDVSVLNYNNTDKKLTLITCEPIVNPTHRLIVHAEMK